MVKHSLIFVCFLIAIFVAVAQALCTRCSCPIDYKPLCAIQDRTGKYRGFNSECVLNCTNECAKNQYRFLGYGRCGAVKKRIQQEERRHGTKKTTTSTSTTTKLPLTTKNINSIPI